VCGWFFAMTTDARKTQTEQTGKLARRGNSDCHACSYSMCIKPQRVQSIKTDLPLATTIQLYSSRTPVQQQFP